MIHCILRGFELLVPSMTAIEEHVHAFFAAQVLQYAQDLVMLMCNMLYRS